MLFVLRQQEGGYFFSGLNLSICVILNYEIFRVLTFSSIGCPSVWGCITCAQVSFTKNLCDAENQWWLGLQQALDWVDKGTLAHSLQKQRGEMWTEGRGSCVDEGL